MGSKYSKATTYITDASNSTYHLPFKSSRVPIAALEEATSNFDVKFLIGRGGIRSVYRAVLCDGTNVALKRHYPTSRKEFQTEIEMLSQLHHPYLVSLIGHCNENNEMILIYDYMENGSLTRHLYGSNLPSMSWEQRLEICIAAARGLHYLHNSVVIHRDDKSSNILLDENFVAKITDFGISKTIPELDQTHLSTMVKGSIGYIAPEYTMWGELREKIDVYSFGVVLFEVLCARTARVQSLPMEMFSLANWAMESQKNGQLERIIDPNLVGKIRPDSLSKFGETAVKCLAETGVDRPRGCNSR